MTDFLKYKQTKEKLNKEKVAKDLQLLEQLDSQNLQLELKIKNSSQADAKAYIDATNERKIAFEQLRADVRTTYGNEIANEAEKAARTFSADIF